MAGLLVIKVAEGQLLQVIERLAPHLGLNVDPEHMPPIGDDSHQPAIDEVDQHQASRSRRNIAPLPGRQQNIDEQLDGNGKTQFQQPGRHRAGKIQQEQAPVWPVIGKEASDEIAHDVGSLVGVQP